MTFASAAASVLPIGSERGDSFSWEWEPAGKPGPGGGIFFRESLAPGGIKCEETWGYGSSWVSRGGSDPFRGDKSNPGF